MFSLELSLVYLFSILALVHVAVKGNVCIFEVELETWPRRVKKCDPCSLFFARTA